MNLTKEQIELAKACTTEAECMAFLKDNRVELSPEELDMVNGGGLFDLFRKLREIILGGGSDEESGSATDSW